MHIFEDSQIQTNQQYSNGGKGVSPNRYLFNTSLRHFLVPLAVPRSTQDNCSALH